LLPLLGNAAVLAFGTLWGAAVLTFAGRHWYLSRQAR
jgi:hypothetical protein